MPGKKRIAIIGGGISGLAAAHYLHGRQSPDGDVFSCEVFEKSGRIGGNGLSAYFIQRYEKPFADLGVNDFNLVTYKHMGDLLQDMENAGFGVSTGRLTDTACFFTARGQQPEVVFTSEDLDKARTPLEQDIATGIALLAKIGPTVMKDPKYRLMSVRTFLDSEGFPPDFGTYYFLPRINGMYFMGDVIPEQMPIHGVMNYYLLQEGIGSGPPDRRYFARGCSDWFRQLTSFLAWRGVGIHLNSEAVVHASAGRPPVVQVNGEPEQAWDAVVLAVPADQVGAVVRDGLPAPMAPLLEAFRYYDATAVAHTFAEVMPARRDDWRTYNIRIFPQGSGPRPYTISYVETMHQGARHAGPPTWFVSENPPVPIPEENVCRMLNPVGDDLVPAQTSFRHNTVTVGTITAQAALPALQGLNNLWYTGGWTHGAGLHEQILAQAFEVAEKMLGHAPVDEPIHTYSDTHPDYVPRYLRNVFDRR